jgi:protein-tyrosine-phosphatase
MNQTVVFVCLHGAAKSRMAAALFNQIAPPGWRAVSAGIEPDLELSPTATRLMAGTDAAIHLDREPPRPVDSLPRVDRLVGIDSKPAGATDHWQLRNREFDLAMRDEIRTLTDALVADIT